MLTFRIRAFQILIGYTAFALVFVSVGIRWHVYRAHAGIHARKELEHTFEAANFARAARNAGLSPESQAQARKYRMLAEMHEKAALENTRLREQYERFW